MVFEGEDGKEKRLKLKAMKVENKEHVDSKLLDVYES